jgi:hypothetical protein
VWGRNEKLWRPSVPGTSRAQSKNRQAEEWALPTARWPFDRPTDGSGQGSDVVTYDETEVPPSEYKGSLIAKIRSKAVIAENLSTGESQRFDSAKLASEALGVHRSSISCVINGKAKSAKGYTFHLADGA